MSNKNIIVGESDDYLEVDVSTGKYPLEIMLIDRADWLHLQELGVGHVSATNTGGRGYLYAIAYIRRKRHYVHRLIIPDSECVDHINHDGLDNRRSNIRASTHGENVKNRRPSVSEMINPIKLRLSKQK